jgi:hypothetical protein
MKKIYKYCIVLLITSMTLNGCKKDFFDVNTDPNNPATADISLVLPTAIGYTAYNLGDEWNIWSGIWSQYWTQGPTAGQYKLWDRYVMATTEMDRPWDRMYSGVLADLDYIISEGNAKGRKNYVAIAMIWKAYVYQYMVDLYGDIPYSEAIKGSENTSPAYDKGDKIYDELPKIINAALAMIDVNSTDVPGADDFIFHGDMSHWIEFANTLKLKIYLRQINVPSRKAAAETAIEAMYTASDAFLTVDAYMPFFDVQFNANPLNTTITALSVANIIGSSTVIDTMAALNDDRLFAVFSKATTGTLAGQYVGIKQGHGENIPNPASLVHTNYSLPSTAVGGPGAAGKTAPVVFMSLSESLFLQAEAGARGLGTADDKDEYEAAIVASYEFLGLDPANAEIYYNQPAVAYPSAMADKLEAIGTQKWFAMCGVQNVEAWIDYRRTGYPDFFMPSESSVLGANKFPGRFLYPSGELTRNKNCPKGVTLVDKIWWDVN